MAVEGEESRQCRPRLFVAGKEPGYAGKNPDQQLAQEWLSGCVFFLVRSAAVEGPVTKVDINNKTVKRDI